MRANNQQYTKKNKLIVGYNNYSLIMSWTLYYYSHSKWDLVGYSGGSPGLENAVKRMGWPIGPICFSVYFDASP